MKAYAPPVRAIHESPPVQAIHESLPVQAIHESPLLNGRLEFCTVGPVPVTGVVEILRQLQASGWEARFVAFSGMVAMQERIATARPVPMPSYMIVAEKFFAEDEEFVPPKINLGIA